MKGEEALKAARQKVIYRHHVPKICKTKTISNCRYSLQEALTQADVHYNGLDRHKGLTIGQYLTPQHELYMTDEVTVFP